MDTLANGILTAQINPVGAELTSLRMEGLERIWQGDPAVWTGHSPLLFPLIGRLIGQQYELDGRYIQAPRHGFCRARPFETVEKADTAVRYRTREDEGTLAVYPFQFTLEVAFSLEKNVIVKKQTVTNRSRQEMPFELGGHDAYCTALMPGECREDYAVAFEGMEVLEPYGMDGEGILTLPKGRIPLNGGVLDKLPQALGLDTVILGDIPIRRVSLFSRKSPRRVTVEFPDFPYLGIWTAQTATPGNYLCLEPWTTLPDGYFMGRRLTDKPGIQILPAGESRTYTYRAEFA